MTELEKAAKEYAEKQVGPHWEKINMQLYNQGGVNPYAYRYGFVAGFLESKEYWQSPPDPSLEEIKERFYTAAGRGDLQNSTDLVDVDAVWEWIEENCLNAIKTSNTKK